MTETTESALPPSEPNTVDALSALTGTSGEIFFERVGGGRGPGWSGDAYMGRRIQLGPVGAFRGETVEQIYSQVTDRAGGGRYRWVGRDQASKPRSGEVFLPGEPKLLSVEDPAAHAEALAGELQGAALDPRYPQSPLDEADSGEWVWSFGQQRYRWTGPGPAPGPPPRHLPGAYYQQQSPYDHTGESATAKELRALREELAALKAAKAAPVSDPMQVVVALLNSQQAAMAVQAGREAVAAKERLDAELAFRRDQLAAQERIAAMQNSLQEKAIHAAPKLQDLTGQLEMLVSFGKKLAGVPEEKPPEEGSKIAEKVVGAIEHGAAALASWAKQPPKPASASEPKQITTEATVRNTAPAGDSMSGIDDETRQWISLLKFTAEQYQSGVPGKAAWFGIYAHCKGSGVDVEKVVDTLSILTGTALVNYMRSRPEPLRSHLSPVADVFATADGSTWLDGVLQAMREHANGDAPAQPPEEARDGG